MTGHIDINKPHVYNLIKVNEFEKCTLLDTVLDLTRVSYVTVVKQRKMDGQNIIFAERGRDDYSMLMGIPQV